MTKYSNYRKTSSKKWSEKIKMSNSINNYFFPFFYIYQGQHFTLNIKGIYSTFIVISLYPWIKKRGIEWGRELHFFHRKKGILKKIFISLKLKISEIKVLICVLCPSKEQYISRNFVCNFSYVFDWEGERQKNKTIQS